MIRAASGYRARAGAALMSAALAFAGLPGAQAQPAPQLPESAQDAAIMCFYSAVLTGRGQAEPMAEAMWFLFDAARTATADAPDGFVDKVEELVAAPPPNLDTLATDAPAMLPQCASRYPLISSKRTITLPADTFARDMQCLALTIYLSDMAQGDLDDTGSEAFVTRLQALEAKLTARLTPERYQAAGLADEGARNLALARALRDVSPVGNLMSILTACEAAAG